MKRTLRYIAILAGALLITVLFQNCGQPGTISAANPVIEGPTGGPLLPDDPISQDIYGIKILTSEKFICEPFGNMNGGDVKGGLKAELAYVDPTLGLEAGVKNAYGAAEYFSDAKQFIKTATPIFL